MSCYEMLRPSSFMTPAPAARPSAKDLSGYQDWSKHSGNLVDEPAAQVPTSSLRLGVLEVLEKGSVASYFTGKKDIY